MKALASLAVLLAFLAPGTTHAQQSLSECGPFDDIRADYDLPFADCIAPDGTIRRSNPFDHIYVSPVQETLPKCDPFDDILRRLQDCAGSDLRRA